VLVSGPDLPFVLEREAAGGWRKRALPAGEEVRKGSGRASPCIVADLDNDGWPDVLQPRERFSLLWKGGAAGFAGAAKCAVRCSGERARSTLGDFDGDGSLDVFVCGQDENRLWENDGAGGFRDVTGDAGSLGYKMTGGASSCLAADLDHDGRPDLAIAYGDTGLVYHFNRGYRCFGEEGGLRLNEMDDPPEIESFGIADCCAGDLDGDGADEFVAVFGEGGAYCFFTSVADVPTFSARPSSGSTGPVTVSAWQGDEIPVCTGTWSLSGTGPPRTFTLRRAGECTLKWRVPGGRRLEKGIVVAGDNPVVLLGTGAGDGSK
jgi:hypothetical protein